MLGRQLCSCWHCGVWSTCTPFQYVSLSKPRERSLSGWLGNAKTQMLGSHVYLFSNRSNMVISVRFFLAMSQAFLLNPVADFLTASNLPFCLLHFKWPLSTPDYFLLVGFFQIDLIREIYYSEKPQCSIHLYSSYYTLYLCP